MFRRLEVQHMQKVKLNYKPAFMYLPACLISQTGGLSTSLPRTASSNKGSVAFIVFGSATVPVFKAHQSQDHVENRIEIHF